MTSKEKLSLLIRCGLRFSSDESRIMDIIREEINKTPTTSEKKTSKKRPSGEWIPINEETIKTLQDHHYYLVAHKYFDTPMKAKYHNYSLKHFEVFLSKSIQISHIFLESSDEITHFMELPELPTKRRRKND